MSKVRILYILANKNTRFVVKTVLSYTQAVPPGQIVRILNFPPLKVLANAFRYDYVVYNSSRTCFLVLKKKCHAVNNQKFIQHLSL
jgi:hypothetical protein